MNEEQSETTNSTDTLRQDIETLKIAQATQAAAMVGAQATQAAITAGTTATQAALTAGATATQAAATAGTWATMVVGSIALIVGLFLGMNVHRAA